MALQCFCGPQRNFIPNGKRNKLLQGWKHSLSLSKTQSDIRDMKLFIINKKKSARSDSHEARFLNEVCSSYLSHFLLPLLVLFFMTHLCHLPTFSLHISLNLTQQNSSLPLGKRREMVYLLLHHVRHAHITLCLSLTSHAANCDAPQVNAPTVDPKQVFK